MLTGISDTLNPRKGQGMTESIIIIAIVLTVLVMSVLGIDIPEIVQNAFTAIIAYRIGMNAKHSIETQGQKGEAQEVKQRNREGGEDDDSEED